MIWLSNSTMLESHIFRNDGLFAITSEQPRLYSRLVLEILPKLSLECLCQLISPMIQWLQFAKEETQHLGFLHEAKPLDQMTVLI